MKKELGFDKNLFIDSYNKLNYFLARYKMTAEEKEQKSKKMDEVFDNTSNIVLSKVKEIVGRDLTDEEKKTLCDSLKVYFMFASLLMGVIVR